MGEKILPGLGGGEKYDQNILHKSILLSKHNKQI